MTLCTEAMNLSDQLVNARYHHHQIIMVYSKGFTLSRSPWAKEGWAGGGVSALRSPGTQADKSPQLCRSPCQNERAPKGPAVAVKSSTCKGYSPAHKGLRATLWRRAMRPCRKAAQPEWGRNSGGALGTHPAGAALVPRIRRALHSQLVMELSRAFPERQQD